MESTITYDIFHRTYWDWRISVDLFLGGIAVGAFIFSVFISWYYKDKYAGLSKLGAVIAPIAMVAGNIFLLAELSQPTRFYNIIFYFNVTSPISWGALLQTMFIGVAGVYAFLWVVGAERLRKVVGWAGVPLAVIIGAYHGYLMSFAYARAMWSSGPYNILHMLAFVTTGIAAVCLLAVWGRGGRNAIKEIAPLVSTILGLALFFQIVASVGWLSAMANSYTSAINAYNVLMTEFGALYWVLAFSVGLVLPLIIVMLIHLWKKPGLAGFALFASSIMIIVGSFFFRYVTIMAGQIS